jgi:N-glycosidase YbiA
MLVIPADNCILYFRRDREMFGFLSRFHPAPTLPDGMTWPTVEHYYQAQKSFDRRIARRSGMRSPPGLAKQLAAPPHTSRRAVRKAWFLKNNALPRPDWHEVKLDIMRRADLANFTQHPDLAALLLATGDAELVEDSPSESFWGTGPDGQGINWAGRVPMEIRTRLQAAS